MKWREYLRWVAQIAAILLMIMGLISVVFLAFGYDLVPTDRVCP